jgi:hypothetical protein
MLSRLKRKGDAPVAPSVPAWHPNFRNYEKLPDIKAVRTAFFVNGVAILLGISLTIYFGFIEWQLRDINKQTAAIQGEIERDKKTSEQAIALFKTFQADEARILEVDTFVKSKPVVSVIISRLGETLPANIAVDSLDFRETGLTMRLSVRGTPDVASGYATKYLEQLRADPQLALFDDFNFTSTPSPNPATGRMAVEFFLHLKGTPAGRK